MERVGLFFPLLNDKIRVHHGVVPGIGGPLVRLQRMQKYFPDCPMKFNIIYTISARISPTICLIAKNHGVKIVQHINSVFHPAYRMNFRELNKSCRKIYKIADHIVFGSRFAKEGAELYLGKCNVPYTIIYNAVDMMHFIPQARPDNRFNILAIGGHYVRHRIEPLILAMPYIRERYQNAKLIIIGSLSPGKGIFNCSKKSFVELAEEVGIGDNTEFHPQYTQESAPEMYKLGDVLVHLKHMDWTPNTVIESMACGLPVLHSGNGGLHEIVGEAGLSLGLPYDWNKIHTPDPISLAEKIMQLYEIRKEKGEIAREIAVKRYDLGKWTREHQRIFEGLLSRNHS
ncbi:MAG: glycosyltransferase family 4 protein [Candidatus Scalindua sp.]|nr:glycosyltransferase family 4 protein [Candidatus Scalindua sp.]